MSPKIKASTVKATKTGFFLFSGGQKEKQTTNKQNFIKHFALFCFLLLPLEVGRLEKDPEKFEAIYQEGLEQMRNEMSHLKTFLGDN